MSDYRTRMLAITDELHARGVGRYTSAPPIFRLAWRLGYDVKPPLYQSFFALAVTAGAWFAVAWGLFAWFTFWSGEGRTLTSLVASAVAGGVFVGVLLAAYYRRKARRLRLPPLGDI